MAFLRAERGHPGAMKDSLIPQGVSNCQGAVARGAPYARDNVIYGTKGTRLHYRSLPGTVAFTHENHNTDPECATVYTALNGLGIRDSPKIDTRGRQRLAARALEQKLHALGTTLQEVTVEQVERAGPGPSAAARVTVAAAGNVSIHGSMYVAGTQRIPPNSIVRFACPTTYGPEGPEPVISADTETNTPYSAERYDWDGTITCFQGVFTNVIPVMLVADKSFKSDVASVISDFRCIGKDADPDLLEPIIPQGTKEILDLLFYSEHAPLGDALRTELAKTIKDPEDHKYAKKAQKLTKLIADTTEAVVSGSLANTSAFYEHRDIIKNNPGTWYIDAIQSLVAPAAAFMAAVRPGQYRLFQPAQAGGAVLAAPCQ